MWWEDALRLATEQGHIIDERRDVALWERYEEVYAYILSPCTRCPYGILTTGGGDVVAMPPAGRCAGAP